MVFAIGPGGTGKTYLAVAMAVSALLSKQVNRIILARPAVEAGERLGFLPGTLQEKVDPYMRPLYDALHDLLEADKLERFLEKGIIEVAPLAFMRGRTLNDSFVILDEAQNTTSEQMKMFLTRLGFNSKAVITGDVTQIDLPECAPLGPGRSHRNRGQDRRDLAGLFRRARRGAPQPGAAHHQGLRRPRRSTHPNHNGRGSGNYRPKNIRAPTNLLRMILNRQRRVRVPIPCWKDFSRPSSGGYACRQTQWRLRWSAMRRLPAGIAPIVVKIARPMYCPFQPMDPGSRVRFSANPGESLVRRTVFAGGGLRRCRDLYLGDIAIAPAVARRNARLLGRTFDHEMRILILHGMLHLMGYDHETDTRTNGPPRKAPAPRTGIGLSMPIFLYSVGVLALTAGLVGIFLPGSRLPRVGARVHGAHSPPPGYIRIGNRAALQYGARPRRSYVQPASAFLASIRGRDYGARRFFFVPGHMGSGRGNDFFLGAEVVIAMQFFPALLISPRAGELGSAVRSSGALVRFGSVWPVQAVLELLISVLHLSEEEVLQTPAAEQQQAIEAFVDAATEEGIIEQDEARLIEQVVEFGDKRVRDVMTPRPDVIAIRATATLEELRDLVVETKFSRLPVHEKSLDDIVGIAMARDMLEVPDREAGHRTVRELVRPALFVPETKFGSELLKEMQRKNQQMAVVIDEYGLMAGVVTIEDLVEEIVGEIGEEDRTPAPDVVREPGGAMVIRGSVQLEKIGELFGVRLDAGRQHSDATTIAGLLNGVAGHVPRTGEVVESDGLRFEVIEANQRKVLRVRAKPLPSVAASTAGTS